MITTEAKARAGELGIYPPRLEYLDAFLKKAIEDGASPSIELIAARRGVPIFSGAYGVSAPGGSPMVPGMITDWQSVTKVITATLVMMLQEDGHFTVRDKVIDYFPEFNGPRKNEVELWQLMCHTSGMSADLYQDYREDFIKKLLGKQPARGTPDEEFDALINNARRGLGHSEEEITKESAYDYLTRMSLGAPLRTPPRERFRIVKLNES